MFFRKCTVLIILLCCVLFISCRNEVNTIIYPPVSTAPSLIAINGNHSVTLGWASPTDASVVELHLHRSTDANFAATSQTLLMSFPPTTGTFIDSNLTNGQRYYYRLVPVEHLKGEVRRVGVSESVTPASPLDYSAVSTIIFSEHIQPIFQSGCAVHGCHAGETPPSLHSFSKQTHGEKFSLMEWEDLFNGGDHGAVVIPYRANKSHLVFHMNSDTTIAPVSLPHMPSVAGLSIPLNQLSLIMRWIDEGAPNDNGAIAFSTFPDGEVLATNQSEDVISIVDVRTGLVARYIQAGLPNVGLLQQPQSPHNITVDKTNGYYYVNLVTAGKVVKYSLSDNRKLGEVSGILSPTQVALSITGDTGFVAQFQNGIDNIRMFDTRTMQLFTQTISSPLLNKPHGVQRTPDGKKIVITGNFSGNVFVYDITSETLDMIWMDPQNPIPSTTFKPYQTIMTDDAKRIYVSCQGSNDVRVIDRDSMKVVKVIPVGTFPLIMDITPDNRLIYVANRNSNSVSVIGTVSNSVVATIENVGPQPHGIAIDKGGKYAYVTCENISTSGPPPHHPTSGSKAPGYIVVIDIATNTVVKTIEVSNFAAGIAVIQ